MIKVERLLIMLEWSNSYVEITWAVVLVTEISLLLLTDLNKKGERLSPSQVKSNVFFKWG